MDTFNPVILYVEDEPRSRKVMQMITSDMGLTRVTIFEDSSDFEARVAALDPKPDLIFLDIHLRPYSGFEMLAMLRKSEAFAHVPVVAMTASVMNEEVQQLHSAGFDGCIAKPLDMDAFPDMVRSILRGQPVWRIIG